MSAPAEALARSAASSGVNTLNFTLISILVGFEILTLSTTPRPDAALQETGPNASIFSASANTTFPTASFSTLPPPSEDFSPVLSAKELTISCSSNMLFTSSVTIAGTQLSPVTSKVLIVVESASLGSAPEIHSRMRSFTVSQPEGSKVISMPTDCPGCTTPMRGSTVNAPTTRGSSGAVATGSSSGSTTRGLRVDAGPAGAAPFPFAGGFSAFFPPFPAAPVSAPFTRST